MPLYLDRNAAGADRIMPVNRIKPHTCFKGPIESGLTKMAVVGFGKQPGAAQIHACGPEEMRNRLLNGIAALKGNGSTARRRRVARISRWSCRRRCAP